MKDIKKSKGITLIALVITIIVMLILVAVTVNITVNGKLFDYAGKAAKDTEHTKQKEQIIANGEIAGKSINDWIEGGSFNCIHGETHIERDTENYTGDIVCDWCGQIVTEGHEYTYTEIFEKEHQGETRPTRFTYGDYEYRYRQYYYLDEEDGFIWMNFPSTVQDGWGVRVIDSSKSNYGEILESAYGYPVNTLASTFRACKALTSAPRIPSSVTDMDCCFGGCTALSETPEIPEGVTILSGAFMACNAMTVAPRIPEGVINITYIFQQSTNLTTAPDIPSSVTKAYGAFAGCTSLKGTITINADFNSSDATYGLFFYNCAKDNNHRITLTGTSANLTNIKKSGYNQGQYISISQ